MTTRFLKSKGFAQGLKFAGKVMDYTSVTVFLGVTGGILYMMAH